MATKGLTSEKILEFSREVERLAVERGIEVFDFANGPPVSDEWVSMNFREKTSGAV